MSFITLAQQAQKELDGETARLKEKETKLDERSSAVAAQAAANLEKTGLLNVKEKELQKREEEVTRREINVRRDIEVQNDLISAQAHHKSASEELKKAQEYRDAAKQDLEELAKREIALSEARKTYKAEVEMEVMRNFTGFRK